MKNLTGLKSSLKKLVADSVFHGPIPRLARWVWDERSLESIVDRSVNPTKCALDTLAEGKELSEVYQGFLDYLEEENPGFLAEVKSLDQVKLVEVIQDAVAQAHRDECQEDSFHYLPTRDGRIFFTTAEMREMKIEEGSMHDIEVSRHWDSDHVVSENMRERARRDFEAPSVLLLDDIELLVQANEAIEGNNALFHPDFIDNVSNIGSADFHVLPNMITQVGREMYNTKSKGFIQASKHLRYCYGTPEDIPSTPENTKFIFDSFDKIGLSPTKVDHILSNPSGYVRSLVDGKKTLRNLNYAHIANDLLTKGATNRCVTLDGNSMAIVTKAVVWGQDVIQKLFGRSVASLVDANHPDYVHPRAGVYNGMMVRGNRVDGFGSFPELEEVSFDSFDADGGSTYFVQTVYGAQAKRNALTMLGLKSRILPQDLEDATDVDELDLLMSIIGDETTNSASIPDWALQLWINWCAGKGADPDTSNDLILQDFADSIMGEWVDTVHANLPILGVSSKLCNYIYTKTKKETGAPPRVQFTDDYGFSIRDVVRHPSKYRRLNITVGKDLYTLGVRGKVRRFHFKEHGTMLDPLAEHGTEVVWMWDWKDRFREAISHITKHHGNIELRSLFDGGMVPASLALIASQTATQAMNGLPDKISSLPEQYGLPHPGKGGNLLDDNAIIVSME